MGQAVQTWHNWSGSLQAQHAEIFRPQTLDDLCHCLKSASAPLRILGSGHSFSALAQCNGSVLALDAFSGLRSYDSQTQTAIFGAATTIGRMAQTLKDIGQALPNMGDIDKQSFAGALATGTHGSGLALGAYHTLLQALQLVDGSGRVHDLRLSDNAEMIHALGCSLGAFGALTQVTLNNMPAYRLHRRRYKMPLADVLQSFHSVMSAHRSVEFFVIPHWDHVAMVTSDITDAPATIRPPEDDEKALAALKKLRTVFKTMPWLRRRILSAALARFEDENYVEDWLKVYPSQRKTRFNEMEYHLPVEEGARAIAEIIALIDRHFPTVYFPIEIRAVAADSFWLSPFYQRPTCSIAVHHCADEDSTAYFSACESIFKKYNGRPHWGKMHSLKARDFAALYPRWADAMALRREFDPQNRLVTPYMAGLFGLDDA